MTESKQEQPEAPKRKRGQGPKDSNQIAFMVVQQATGEAPREDRKELRESQGAITLGRAGGLQGGKARPRKASD